MSCVECVVPAHIRFLWPCPSFLTVQIHFSSFVSVRRRQCVQAHAKVLMQCNIMFCSVPSFYQTKIKIHYIFSPLEICILHQTIQHCTILFNAQTLDAACCCLPAFWAQRLLMRNPTITKTRTSTSPPRATPTGSCQSPKTGCDIRQRKEVQSDIDWEKKKRHWLRDFIIWWMVHTDHSIMTSEMEMSTHDK